MNGIEAASILKRLLPATAIILFTMYSDSIRAAPSSAVGVDAALAKPDGLSALGNAIDAVLARRAAQSLS